MLSLQIKIWWDGGTADAISVFSVEIPGDNIIKDIGSNPVPITNKGLKYDQQTRNPEPEFGRSVSSLGDRPRGNSRGALLGWSFIIMG